MFRTLICIFPVLFGAVKSFSQVDTMIGLVKNKYGTDHYALAAAISFDQKGDKAKANAIYNWVTHNIAYDVEVLRKFPKNYESSAIRALKTGRAVCEGYSELFTMLCRDAGLQAVTIEGYAKDWIFDNGGELYIPRHKWSAVKIDGKWELVDATWGAGSVYADRNWLQRFTGKLLHGNKVNAKHLKFKYWYTPKYFMQDPETFRMKHLPSDPLWQLTDSLMPLEVYEAGDAAMRRFNQVSKPLQTGKKLDSIAKLDERQKIVEFADRAYAYNERYPVIQALKNIYHAETVVAKAAADTTPQRDVLLKKAESDLKTSLEYIKEQRKSFPKEYSKLKKNNRAKSMDAKQNMRMIVADDKRLLALCRRYMKIAESRSEAANARLSDIAGVQKPDGAVGVSNPKDSLAAREARGEVLKRSATEQANNAKVAIVRSTSLLDSLMHSLDGEDSMLRNEAIERMGMRDSYDDEVKMWNEYFRKQKYDGTDTLMKYYFLAFDTISAKYEQVLATHAASLDIYQRGAGDYNTAKDAAMTDTRTYITWLEGNIKLFGMLERMYQRQIEIVAYMEKADKGREGLESGSITRKKAFDLKENDRQRASVQKGLKEVRKTMGNTN